MTGEISRIKQNTNKCYCGFQITTAYSWDEGHDVPDPWKTCSDVRKRNMDIKAVK